MIEVWLMIRFQKFTNILIILLKIIQILIADIGISPQIFFDYLHDYFRHL